MKTKGFDYDSLPEADALVRWRFSFREKKLRRAQRREYNERHSRY
jgi:hypothetical protein